MTPNGKFLVFTRSADSSSWTLNDLMFAYNYQAVSVIDHSNQEEYGIKISPNPGIDYISLELKNSENINYEDAKLSIFNAEGRYLERISFEDNAKRILLSTIEYAPEIYFYKLNSEKEFLTSGSFVINEVV